MGLQNGGGAERSGAEMKRVSKLGGGLCGAERKRNGRAVEHGTVYIKKGEEACVQAFHRWGQQGNEGHVKECEIVGGLTRFCIYDRGVRCN